MLEFGIFILGFWACDLVFESLGLKFGSLGDHVWDSVLGFVIWLFLFGIWSLGFRVWGFAVGFRVHSLGF